VTGVFTISEPVTDGLTGAGTVISVDYLLNLIVIRETAAMTLGQTITGGGSGTQCQIDTRERIDIDVSIDLGTTLASAVVAAVDGHAVIPLYADASIYGTGAQTAGAAAYANLTGGEDESDENAGRLFADGFAGMLVEDVDYVNNNTVSNDIHPIITGVSTTSVADDTITDSSANYDTNSLIGRALVPDITTPGSTYTIIANTATTITVSSSMTGVAVARNNYRVNLSTPTAPRSDLVVVDMYFEEVGSADDSDLQHAFATPDESMRRLKVRQIVRVIEGYSATPDLRHTDSDGTPHAVIPIAILNRTTSTDIETSMIVDQRPDLSGFVDIKNEVVEARGNRGALGDRLNQSLDANGDLLSGAAVTALTAVSPVLVDGGAGPETGSVAVSMPAAVSGAPGTPGHMTAAQVDKLAGIAAGAQANPTVEDSGGGVSVSNATVIQADRNYYDVQNPAGTTALITPSNDLVVRGFSAETSFKVVPDSPNADQVKVLKGLLLTSDNSGVIVRTTDSVAVTAIPLVTVSGRRRYDIVEVDNNGAINHTTGTMVVPTGSIPDQVDLNASLPSLTDNRSLLAIIVIDYTDGISAPVIDETMIVDARPFVRGYRPAAGISYGGIPPADTTGGSAGSSSSVSRSDHRHPLSSSYAVQKATTTFSGSGGPVDITTGFTPRFWYWAWTDSNSNHGTGFAVGTGAGEQGHSSHDTGGNAAGTSGSGRVMDGVFDSDYWTVTEFSTTRVRATRQAGTNTISGVAVVIGDNLP